MSSISPPAKSGSLAPLIKTSTPPPSNNTESLNALKKKLQFLSKEFVKQRKELERVSQIALQQHEDIEYQNNLIITLTEQCQKQQELIRDLDSTVNIERHLCDNAIRISKRLESTSTPTVNENGEDEQTKRLLAQAEDDNAPEEKPTTPTQHEKQTKDPIYLVVDDNENPELDTVQELREENGLLRMELFSEREERHKIEYEKIHLLELVQQLSSRLNQ